MTDNDPAVLGAYDGKPVLTTSVAVTHAGDGLSEALGIAPQQFGIGEKVFLLLETTCLDHRHRPIKDAPNSLNLLQRLKAGTATIVTEAFAASHLDEQRRLIQEAKDRAEGRIGLLSPEELQAAHEAGQHAEATVPNCPPCDAEAAAVAEEERADQPTPIAGRRKR